MKYKLSLLLLWLYLSSIVYNQRIQDPKFIRAWHFKNNLNPDFGIPLDTTEESFILLNLVNNLPEYCCLNDAKYNFDNSILLVNNATTFDQWFTNSVDFANERCNNYELSIPITESFIGSDPSKVSFIHVAESDLIASLDNSGFNNVKEFPEYIDDQEKYLFCWSIEFSYAVPPNEDTRVQAPYGVITVSAPGESFLFIDGVLVAERGGVGDYGSIQYSEFSFEEKKANVFGCSRSNTVGDIYIEMDGFSTDCDYYSICSTCGLSNCEASLNLTCPTNEINCKQGKQLCGECIQVEFDCEDNDPCTIDSCEIGSGCKHVLLDDCVCNEDINCITTDLCFPKECISANNCTEIPVVCYGSESCFEPTCIDGNCICGTHPSGEIPITIAVSSGQAPVTTIAVTITTQSTTGLVTTIGSETGETIISTQSTTSISSIATSIESSSSTISSSISSTSSNHKPEFICDVNSCPLHYCCIQLSKSFTCVSKIFENKCSPHLLNQFY